MERKPRRLGANAVKKQIGGHGPTASACHSSTNDWTPHRPHGVAPHDTRTTVMTAGTSTSGETAEHTTYHPHTTKSTSCSAIVNYCIVYTVYLTPGGLGGGTTQQNSCPFAIKSKLERKRALFSLVLLP